MFKFDVRFDVQIGIQMQDADPVCKGRVQQKKYKKEGD